MESVKAYIKQDADRFSVLVGLTDETALLRLSVDPETRKVSGAYTVDTFDGESRTAIRRNMTAEDIVSLLQDMAVC